MAEVRSQRQIKKETTDGSLVLDNSSANSLSASLTLDLPAPFIHVLYFVPKEALSPELQLKDSTFIFPDEGSRKGSTTAFVCLLNQMVQKGSCILTCIVLILLRLYLLSFICLLLISKRRRCDCKDAEIRIC